MKILYYTWNECTYEDCIDCMKSLGWQVSVLSEALKDYDTDDSFISKMDSILKSSDFDCVFTFNYFPIFSTICMEHQIPYISWVYDSPHLTLDSITLKNTCNSVFTFDRATCEYYRSKGISTIHYMPLAYHHIRLQNKLAHLPLHYEHTITFLGNLYDNEYNFFDRIQYLPPELKGYIDGLIHAQQLIYGYDLCNDLFDQEKCNELGQYVDMNMGPLYTDYRDGLFRNMIRKKMTMMERREFMQMIGEKYPLDLYAPAKPENLPVHYCGYADYKEQMPEIFYTSKINLNITLRSILSGIPLRVIDILGANGFLLTNYQPELSEYFENGTDLVWFESLEDCMDKIAFYLNHDAEREHIANNGHKKVKEFFTYEKLLPKIIQESFS